MAIGLEPTTIIAGSASVIAILPPGPCSVSVSAGAGTAGMYVGLGTALSPSNGLYIPGGYPPFTLMRPPGVGGRMLYGVAASGTVTAVVLTVHG
jgi:hypothetical protein